VNLFPTKILLATDGTEVSTPASRAAAELSARTGSEVHLVYVGDEISDTLSYAEFDSDDEHAARRARELLDEQARRIEADGGTVADLDIIAGNEPDEEIVKLTREPDVRMVVVGSRGLNWLEEAIKGSVSSSVVRDARCPVLVVHEDDA
jgi:nucleotide-binding universal stress UspA family protein